MHHGVSVRFVRAALLPLAIAVCAACVVSPAARPGRESPLAGGPKRCGEGPGPIEILPADVVIAFRHSRYTDYGDSKLAAELAAVGRLIEVARLGGMRFAIVSYSGRQEFPLEDSVTQHVDRSDARLEATLTDDPAALQAAVARVARRGPDGASSFAPAMRLALRSLTTADAPAARRRVLFLSDSATPVRFAPMNRIAYDDARMEIEARRAIASGISFHSFGIGEAADADTAQALAQIAGATGGTYRPVPDPRALYCQMLAALGAHDPRR